MRVSTIYFSRVRAHTDAAAEESANDVKANAYAVGHQIVFGLERFDFNTTEGRWLLAYELAHVVQPRYVNGLIDRAR